MSNIIHFRTPADRALTEADRAFTNAVALAANDRVAAISQMIQMALGSIAEAEHAALIWLADNCGIHAVVECGRVVGIRA